MAVWEKKMLFFLIPPLFLLYFSLLCSAYILFPLLSLFSLPFSFFPVFLCCAMLFFATLCNAMPVYAMQCFALFNLFCLLLVLPDLLCDVMFFFPSLICPFVCVLIFQFFIPFLCSHLLILKLIQFLFILIQGPVKRKRPPKNRSSAGPFQNTRLSSSAQTHTWKKLRSASKCRECDSYVYFNGAECEICGLTCHKKCLGRLNIKCGAYNVITT